MELMFILLFRYVRQMRSKHLAKAAEKAAELAAQAKVAIPLKA
jgi:hypothetical protein